MSKEFQIRDGNLIASFDLENEDGDIDFCKLLKVSHGVADEIGMFVDYVATNKIIKDQSKQIADLEAKLAECEKERHEEWKTGKEWKWEWQKVTQKLEKAEQDKISFAVEQLEQTRKEFEIKFKGCKWEDKMLVGKFCNITNEIIDNQIEELKKEMK